MTNVRVTWHAHAVDRTAREELNGHRGCVIWLTGLSGSGKSSVANAIDHLLYGQSVHTFLLDGDNVRHGLNASPERLAANHGAPFASRFGLGFDAIDREENIRRIGSVAQLFCSAGIVVLTAFVSPYRRDRQLARDLVVQSGRLGDFVEVYIDTPLEICESRDPKGLYDLARQGKIQNFTGINDPYEVPESPELVLAGAQRSPAELAQQVVDYLESHGHIPKKGSRGVLA